MNLTRSTAFWVLMAACFTSMVTATHANGISCQILDRIDEANWKLGFSYLLPAEVQTEIRPDKDHDVDVFEMQGGYHIGYYRTAWGTVDLSALADFSFMFKDGGIRLPHQVGALRFGVRWDMRSSMGLAARIEAFPGIYNDLETLTWDSLGCPLGLAGVYALTPTASALLGVHFYPGFDRWIDPWVGIRWAPTENLLLDLFYPESRLTWMAGQGWDIYAGFRVRRVDQYALTLKDDPERGWLRYDESRLYVGGSMALLDTVRVAIQAGWVFDRKLEFEKEMPGADVDDTFFFAVSLNGWF